MFDDADVISVYTLEQAIEDGVLIEVFKESWQELSGGKPIVATSAIHSEFTLAALREIWNEFVVWRREVMPTLPVEDQLFATHMNDQKYGFLKTVQPLPYSFRRIINTFI
jgi:hypothetical protein